MVKSRGTFGHVLQVLGGSAQVLPATGQATVDLTRPDIDEAYDQASSGDQRVEGIFERPNRELYRDLSPVGREKHHLFRYFLDGSTRIYFIGTVLEHERSSPVQIAQAGAACVYREDDGKLRVHRPVRIKTALLLDKSALSDVLWHSVDSVIEEDPDMELLDSSDRDHPYGEFGGNEPRSRGTHRANWLMRQQERKIALDDLADRSDDGWLIVDGSLGNEYLGWGGSPVIGVVKTFRRDSTFTIGSGPRRQELNVYGLLAGLGENERTIVFPRKEENRPGDAMMAFWYVRLRPQHGLDYPLMGVVKVEVPCREGEPLNSEYVDMVSSCLLAERNVTVHGQDSRWHAHLYPIAQAERVIKDSFVSEEVIKASIRWPRVNA